MPGTQRPGPRVLFVEGQDDKHIIWHLCDMQKSLFVVQRVDERLTVTPVDFKEEFYIEERGNSSRLIGSIQNEVRVAGRESLGIVVDADDDPTKRWGEVIQEFQGIGIHLPATPDPHGTVVEGQAGLPKIGVWLMPTNYLVGEVEDFLIPMISKDDVVWPLSNDYIENIPYSARGFEPDKSAKAVLFAWLATRKEPGRLGAAINGNNFDITHPVCQSFYGWLVRLFA